MHHVYRGRVASPAKKSDAAGIPAASFRLKNTAKSWRVILSAKARHKLGCAWSALRNNTAGAAPKMRAAPKYEIYCYCSMLARGAAEPPCADSVLPG